MEIGQIQALARTYDRAFEKDAIEESRHLRSLKRRAMLAQELAAMTAKVAFELNEAYQKELNR